MIQNMVSKGHKLQSLTFQEHSSNTGELATILNEIFRKGGKNPHSCRLWQETMLTVNLTFCTKSVHKNTQLQAVACYLLSALT